ncbi:MAG: hypothetical protein QXI58_00715 [Candidatus Micrarchaeia archaeon]
MAFITKFYYVDGLVISVMLDDDKDLSFTDSFEDSFTKEIYQRIYRFREKIDFSLTFKYDNNFIIHKVEMDGHYIPYFLQDIKNYLRRASEIRLEYVFEDLYSYKKGLLIFSNDGGFNPDFVNVMGCRKGRFHLEKLVYQNNNYKLTFRSRNRRVNICFSQAEPVLNLLKKQCSLRNLRKELSQAGIIKIKGENIRKDI